MNPHPANPIEPPAPPAVDISSEAVAERAEMLRRDGMYPLSAGMLEALAADRDRLKSQLDGCSHANAIMAWNLAAEQRGTDAIAEERDRLARRWQSESGANMSERQAALAMREDIATRFERILTLYPIFSREQLVQIVRSVPLPDPPDLEPPDPRDAMIGTDVSDAAIADAIAEEEAKGLAERRAAEFASQKATIARLSAQIEAAREALAPFATHAELYDDERVNKPDDFELGYGVGLMMQKTHAITIGHFRRARAARAKLSEGA